MYINHRLLTKKVFINLSLTFVILINTVDAYAFEWNIKKWFKTFNPKNKYLFVYGDEAKEDERVTILGTTKDNKIRYKTESDSDREPISCNDLVKIIEINPTKSTVLIIGGGLGAIVALLTAPVTAGTSVFIFISVVGGGAGYYMAKTNNRKEFCN